MALCLEAYMVFHDEVPSQYKDTCSITKDHCPLPQTFSSKYPMEISFPCSLLAANYNLGT